MIDTDAGVVARSPFLRVSRPSSAVIELIIRNSYSIWVEPIAPPERNANAHTAVIFITTQLPRMFGNSCWRQDTHPWNTQLKPIYSMLPLIVKSKKSAADFPNIMQAMM